MSKISYQGSPRKAVMSQPTDSFEFAFTRADEAGVCAFVKCSVSFHCVGKS
jgi:hypothetical protein